MKNGVIGVDIGYGFTKVYGDNKLIRIFPSQVSRGNQRGSFGAPDNIIIINGQCFMVGDNAGSFGDCSVSRSNFLGTPDYLALLGEAVAAAKYPCNMLVLGLPPGLFTENRIMKLEMVISKASITSNNVPVRIPKAIKFVPQGAGIYFDYINSLQHNNQQPKGNVVVIDIGHYTLDIVLFSNLKYVADAARSYPLGISKLYNNIKDHFSKTHGSFLNNDEKILSLIRTGSFTHFDETHKLDVKPLVDEYINQQVLKTVGNYAAEMNKSVDKIVIGGGGVQCMREQAGQAVIIEDPQMSNARGYYQYGRRLIGETSTDEVETGSLRVCANS